MFQHHDFASGTDRIILANLSTGQTSDLFNAFEASQDHAVSPGITPDGKTVLTGGPGLASPIVVDGSNFPAGPYAKNPGEPGNSKELLVDPVATGSSGGSPAAWRSNSPTHVDEPLFVFQFDASLGFINLGSVGRSTHTRSFGAKRECGCGFDGVPHALVPDAISLRHPSIGSPGGVKTVVYDQHKFARDGSELQSDIVSCPFDSAPVGCTPLLGVDSPLNQTRPAFTPDSRYLGFIRQGSGHPRLLVFDSETQTLLNSGVDLGNVLTPDSGNLSLYEQPVFSTTGLNQVAVSGAVQFSLTTASGVGILVQRVVGHHKLFGRSVPKLKRIGRVPLGAFRKGRSHAHWDLRVNGKRLRPGIYQVTLRALTKGGKVRDLAKPHIIQVR